MVNLQGGTLHAGQDQKSSVMGTGACWMLDCASLKMVFCEAKGEGDDKAPIRPLLGSPGDIQTPFLSAN